MTQDLIEQVASEVVRRAAPRRTALLLGRHPNADLGWNYVLSGSFEAVMIGSLSAAQLLQFPDDASVEALLSGKPVYLWEGGLDYRSHARTANRVLWSRLLAAERSLKQLGVQFLSDSVAPLLTAAEMRRLLAAGRIPKENCRMTPLARDILEGRA